jgi:restriction system protein
MLPLLKIASDGQEHSIRSCIAILANHFGLTEEELNIKLPSGRDTQFSNRVRWAGTYLKKAGLLESTGRGKFQITPRGFNILEANPNNIDKDYLMQFESFVEFQELKPTNQGATQSESQLSETEQTPQELLYSNYLRLREELAQDILEQIMVCSSTFFERLVVELLVAMGYGGSIEDAGRAVGRTHDGGIDGIIKEDKLGFDVIYIQAKRWRPDNAIGRPEVQAFAGSLMGFGVTKGAFITTSRFSKEARDYAENLKQLQVILIDGRYLAELMMDHDLGVSPENTYVIKRLDSDYFDVEQVQ